MKEKVIEWLFNGETGLSSMTIAASVLRVDYKRADIPYDKDDFSRCYKLVKFADIPKSELEILAKNYPQWEKFVENWDKLTDMYEKNRNYSDTRFYEYIKSLRK